MRDEDGRLSPGDEFEANAIFMNTMYRAAYAQPEERWEQDPDGEWHHVLVPVNVPQIAAQEYVKFKRLEYAIVRYVLLWCLIVVGPLMFWDVYSEDFFHQFVMWAWFVAGNLIWLNILVVRVKKFWPETKALHNIP